MEWWTRRPLRPRFRSRPAFPPPSRARSRTVGRAGRWPNGCLIENRILGEPRVKAKFFPDEISGGRKCVGNVVLGIPIIMVIPAGRPPRPIEEIYQDGCDLGARAQGVGGGGRGVPGPGRDFLGKRIQFPINQSIVMYMMSSSTVVSSLESSSSMSWAYVFFRPLPKNLCQST